MIEYLAVLAHCLMDGTLIIFILLFLHTTWTHSCPLLTPLPPLNLSSALLVVWGTLLPQRAGRAGTPRTALSGLLYRALVLILDKSLRLSSSYGSPHLHGGKDS